MCILAGMDDTEIERKLTETQAAVIAARKARVDRQEAVMEALAAGWSKYRIAATLGVKAPTVDSIIAAAERDTPGTETRDAPAFKPVESNR
jgi:DNA-binding NarL/FixJ family response regulator